MSKPTVTITTADGDDLVLPAAFQVCPRCHGEGSHVNPAVDGNGLTSDDFAEDPDFAEEYMRGSYDVPCEQCAGERVVSVVDEHAMAADQLAEWRAHLSAERDDRCEAAYERRIAECGEWY